MFKGKTLFVVGAGASCEVGLQTGSELKAKIAELVDIRFQHGSTQISGSQDICEALREAVRQPDGRSGNINPYLAAAWTIRDAAPQAISIDNFIEAHEGDQKIELCGKLGIVEAILNAERKSRLFVRSPEMKFAAGVVANTWYEAFFQLLTENIRRSALEKTFENVAFIVFNYDRCIEQFLVHALRTYYAVSEDVAYELVSKIELYHPYGSVGYLPWQGSVTGVTSFGEEPRGKKLLEISAQIRTFTERVEEGATLDAMRELVSGARTILFLGFAFHQMNMKLINPQRLCNASRVFWTSRGISSYDQDAVSGDIQGLLHKKDEDIRIETVPNGSCADLFKNYWKTLQQL